MTVESATYVDELNSSYPASGDAKSEGDDHIRLIKAVLLATFPSVSGAVSLTDTQLNALASAAILGTAQAWSDSEQRAVKLRDYSETLTTVAASGASYAMDYSASQNYDITLTAACTLSITNPPASGSMGSVTVILRQGGSGSYGITDPAGTVWPNGTAPTLSTAVGKVDILSYMTVDGGSTWFGFVNGQTY